MGNPSCLVPMILSVKAKILSSAKRLPHYVAFVTALVIKMQIRIFPFDYTKYMSKTVQVRTRFRNSFEESSLVSVRLKFSIILGNGKCCE